MGIQKVAFNFLVERSGKLAKSFLCTDAAQKRFKEFEDFEEYEKYFKTMNGKYNENALNIVTEFPDKDWWIPFGEAIEVIKSVNLTKIDKNAFMELRNIFIELAKKGKVEQKKAHIFFLNAINKDGSFDRKALEEAKVIIEKYLNSRHPVIEIPTEFAFKNFKNFKSIEELSISEKNDFLTKLISNPFNIKNLFLR